MIRLGIKDSSFEALLLSVYRYIYIIYIIEGFFEGLERKNSNKFIFSREGNLIRTVCSNVTSDTAEVDRVPRAAYDSSSNTSFTRSNLINGTLIKI